MILTHILFPFLATIAYGILFSVPRKALIGGGIIGMSGWLFVYLVSQYWLAHIPTVLMASFIVASVSQLVARKLKMPSTNFSVAGIIPLVPGAMAYRTMRSFVAGDNVEGVALAIETLLSAGAIAAGLMISLSIFFVGKGFVSRYGAKQS